VSFNSGRSIINYGTIIWQCNDPAGNVTFTLAMEGTAGIDNRAGAQIFISSIGTATQRITGPANAGKLTNAGTLDLYIEKAIDIDLPFENLGGNTRVTGAGRP